MKQIQKFKINCFEKEWHLTDNLHLRSKDSPLLIRTNYSFFFYQQSAIYQHRKSYHLIRVFILLFMKEARFTLDLFFLFFFFEFKNLVPWFNYSCAVLCCEHRNMKIYSFFSLFFSFSVAKNRFPQSLVKFTKRFSKEICFFFFQFFILFSFFSGKKLGRSMCSALD